MINKFNAQLYAGAGYVRLFSEDEEILDLRITGRRDRNSANAALQRIGLKRRRWIAMAWGWQTTVWWEPKRMGQ